MQHLQMTKKIDFIAYSPLCLTLFLRLLPLPHLVSDLKTYEDNLPRYESPQTELEVWQAQSMSMNTPSSVIQAVPVILVNTSSKELFPNIRIGVATS